MGARLMAIVAEGDRVEVVYLATNNAEHETVVTPSARRNPECQTGM